MINSSEQVGIETQKDLTKNFVQDFKNQIQEPQVGIRSAHLCPKQNRHYDVGETWVKSLDFEYSMYTWTGVVGKSHSYGHG